MKPHAPQNPERKSTNAIFVFCLGAVLGVAAWFLGFGSALTAALAGQDPAAMVGGVAIAIALLLLAVLSFICMAVGGVWMVLQVLADQAKGDRYSRDVER